MGRFQRSWTLVKASWSVLRSDRELLWLPVLSGLASLVVIGSFFLPIFVLSDGTGGTFDPGPMGYVLAFLGYTVLAYVTIFFNTALVCGADQRLRGGDPTLGSALRGAASHAGVILPWALLSATVTIILRAIEERFGFVGRLVAGLAGVAWSLVTFLVLPVLVIEGVGVGTAVKRSGELFKRTWGENVIANAGISLIGFLAAIPAFMVIGLAIASGILSLQVIGVVVGVGWLLAVAIVSAALTGVYQVALYRFATDGTAPGAFATVDLGGAFHSKQRGGWLGR